METKEILELVGTIISAGALIVSVSVFLFTIKKTIEEKKQNLATEKFCSFLKAIEDFFRLIDPQKYYDNYSIIYGSTPFDFAEKYAEIKRFNSSIFYQSQEIRIFTPNESRSAEIIIDLLSSIEEKAIMLNNSFCNDIQSKHANRSTNIDLEKVMQMQEDYQQTYEDIVAFVFRGLHITRDSLVFGNSAIKEYEKDYISKYKK